MRDSLSSLSSKVKVPLAVLALYALNACGSVPPTTSF